MKTFVQFTGKLPARLRRDIKTGEEWTFPVTVTTRVTEQSVDVFTGEEVVTIEIVKAQEPSK